MTENLFNTPADELNRLVTEFAETKEALRELSGRLTRIETRLMRVFPQAFVKKNRESGREKRPADQAPPTFTPETALAFYEKLVERARNGQFEQARQELSNLGLPDLSFLRRELGTSLGKKKPSAKALTELILGRVRESVMLSKHTDRQQLLAESGRPNDPSKENQKD